MKNVLAWVKSNLLIVICTAVILISLPVGFVFSSKWNKEIRTKREEAARGALSELTKASVTYGLPAALPGEKPIEVRGVPTTAMTEWFKAERARVEAEVSGVIAKGEAFNKGSHEVLVKGLFPRAASQRAEGQAILEFVNVLIGRPEAGQPSAYERLFSRFNAGPKADAVRIAEIIKDLNERQREANGNRQLTAEEEDGLRKELVDRRMGELRRRAQEISFFADPSIFQVSGRQQLMGFSGVPITRPEQLPTIDQAFVNQWDYWVISDLLAAISRANTSPEGELLDVERATVKRIVSIQLKDPPVVPPNEFATPGARPSEFESSGPEPEFAFEGGVPLDRSKSITGRKSDRENNKVYDTREAILTIIISTDKLQQFLSALSQTNFMTVIDLDLAEVDVWAHLADGYYYGSDHVMQCTLTIESIWLRSWLQPLMPYGSHVNAVGELPAWMNAGDE